MKTKMKNFDEFLNEKKLDKMSNVELRKYVMNNFIASKANLDELVDVTKDYTTPEQMSIAYSLGMTASALYCSIMKQKYNKEIPI